MGGTSEGGRGGFATGTCEIQLQPSHTQSAGRLGLAASPAAERRDWGLKSRPEAGTGPGLGLEYPADGQDLDLSPRLTAGTGRPVGLKSRGKAVFKALNRVKLAQIRSGVLGCERH